MDQAADIQDLTPQETLAERVAKWVWRGTIGGVLLSLVIHLLFGVMASFFHIGGLPSGRPPGESGGAESGIQMAILTEGELDAIAGPQIDASTPTAPELEVSTPVESELIDASISELETRLDPEKWVRIHRSTLVHLPFVQEVHGFFGGRLVVRLKDGKKTELQVARERVAALKLKLGL